MLGKSNICKENIMENNSNIYESCIAGICSGECRKRYYDICSAHQKFYLDELGKRVYLPSQDINWKEIEETSKKKPYTKIGL